MKNKLLALLSILAAVLYGLLGLEKKKSVEHERDIAKANEKAGDKATKALVEGLENENHPVKRGHFDK